MRLITAQFVQAKIGPIGLQGRGRDTGRQQHKHIQRQLVVKAQNIIKATGPQNIDDLMRVQHHRGGAVRDRGPGELDGGEHGAFQMQMTVYQTGADDFAADVQARPFVIAQAHDKSVRDGHVSPLQSALKHVGDLSAPQHQIRRRLAPGRQNSLLKSF